MWNVRIKGHRLFRSQFTHVYACIISGCPSVIYLVRRLLRENKSIPSESIGLKIKSHWTFLIEMKYLLLNCSWIDLQCYLHYTKLFYCSILQGGGVARCWQFLISELIAKKILFECMFSHKDNFHHSLCNFEIWYVELTRVWMNFKFFLRWNLLIVTQIVFIYVIEM